MVDCGLKQSAKDAPSTDVVTRQFTSLLLLHYRFHITTDRITSRHKLLICLDCGLHGILCKMSVFFHLPSLSQETKMDPLHASCTKCTHSYAIWSKLATSVTRENLKWDLGLGAIVCNTISPSVSYPAHSVILASCIHLLCPFLELVGKQHRERRGTDPASLQHGHSMHHDEWCS